MIRSSFLKVIIHTNHSAVPVMVRKVKESKLHRAWWLPSWKIQNARWDIQIMRLKLFWMVIFKYMGQKFIIDVWFYVVDSFHNYLYLLISFYWIRISVIIITYCVYVYISHIPFRVCNNTLSNTTFAQNERISPARKIKYIKTNMKSKNRIGVWKFMSWRLKNRREHC